MTQSRTPNSGAIDRGDDLLAGPLSSDTKTSETVEERLHSAHILISEGFSDEAKQILRRILIADPHFVPARTALDEIHARELKQIFSEQAPAPSREMASSAQSSMDILESLGGISLLSGAEDAEEALFATDDGPARRLIGSPDAMQKFCIDLESRLNNPDNRDRIDMGIGFLEMGLGEVALDQFERVRKRIVSEWLDQSPPSDLRHMPIAAQSELVSVVCLIAVTHLRSRRPFDASLVLQALLRDLEIDVELKTDVLYLLGRAAEQMDRRKDALEWFIQADRLESGYRDTVARMARLTEK